MLAARARLYGSLSTICRAALQRPLCSHSSSIKDDEERNCRPTTPWVRQVINGVEIMRNPKYNKGLAFSDAERERLYIRGLLPPATLSMETQVQRTILNLRGQHNDLDRYSYLSSLLERNERLFYRVLVENFEEVLPIIGEPTVEYAAQKYGLMFRSLPRGMFLGLADNGSVFTLLKNWPERRVKVIVLTDGERVGKVGDLGVHAINICTSNLSLYTACGGINPNLALPVVVDVGTDSDNLLHNPFYVGVKHHRVRGERYNELMDDVLGSIVKRYGRTTLIHLEDMRYENSQRLVQQFRGVLPIVSDSEGIAAAVLAGLLSSTAVTDIPIQEQTIMIVGDGGVAATIAELAAAAIAKVTGDLLVNARRRVHLVDSAGLVGADRGDSDTIDDYKLSYMHEDAPVCPTLLQSIDKIKPTALIGYCTSPTSSFSFNEDVCAAMAKHNERPVLIPVCLPGASSHPKDILEWTHGRGLYAGATGHHFSMELEGGVLFKPGQCTSKYIFPGLALGTMVARANRLKEEQLLAAAETVASMVTDQDRAVGSLYPRIGRAREVAAMVARAVALKAYEGGFATETPKPHDLLAVVQSYMYKPAYRAYR